MSWRGVHPSYEQIGQRLTTLLETTGCAVREDFPRFAPKGAMSAYDHATKTLILHPWISPRARTDALLHETVKRLIEQAAKPTTQRGTAAPAPRDWVVREDMAWRYGLGPDAPNRQPAELTIIERALVNRMVEVIEGRGPTR